MSSQGLSSDTGVCAIHRRGPTRKEVARLAGVSVAVVSHVLSGTRGVRVSEETRQRVTRVADGLGYQPQLAGKTLVSGRSYAAGLLLPSYSAAFTLLYSSILSGLFASADTDGYALQLMFRHNRDACVRPFRQRRIDGVLVLQSDFEEENIRQLEEADAPTVVINYDYRRTRPNISCIMSDHRRMVREALFDLAARGCRSVLMVNDPNVYFANRKMQDSFREALADGSFPGLKGEALIPIHEDFPAQIRAWLGEGRRYDGYLVNSLKKYGDVLVEEAGKLGLEAGRDYHLVSYETAAPTHSRPRIDEVLYCQQGENIGRLAWKTLSSLIDQDGEAPETALLPYLRSEFTKG